MLEFINQNRGNQGNQGGQSGSNEGRGSNLTEEDRRRGGERSAQSQSRDDQGQFAGSRDRDGNRSGSSSGGSSGGSNR